MEASVPSFSERGVTADLQKMFKMSICNLYSLPTEWALLHHVDKSRFKLKVTIFNPVMILALDGAEKSLMHFRAVAAIGTGSLGVDVP
jgi:hypothetical protein